MNALAGLLVVSWLAVSGTTLRELPSLSGTITDTACREVLRGLYTPRGETFGELLLTSQVFGELGFELLGDRSELARRVTLKQVKGSGYLTIEVQQEGGAALLAELCGAVYGRSRGYRGSLARWYVVDGVGGLALVVQTGGPLLNETGQLSDSRQVDGFYYLRDNVLVQGLVQRSEMRRILGALELMLGNAKVSESAADRRVRVTEEVRVRLHGRSQAESELHGKTSICRRFSRDFNEGDPNVLVDDVEPLCGTEFSAEKSFIQLRGRLLTAVDRFEIRDERGVNRLVPLRRNPEGTEEGDRDSTFTFEQEVALYPGENRIVAVGYRGDADIVHFVLRYDRVRVEPRRR